MYERFTDRARKVMQLANQEAQRFNHEYIGTEHILLGLVKEGAGVAANVLKNLDLDLCKVRLEVEKIVQAGPDMVTVGKLPQTPRAKKVIEYAIEESRNLNQSHVGTEHLLLGLLREEEGLAAQVLENLGVSMERVRAELREVIGDEVGPLVLSGGAATKTPVLDSVGVDMTEQARQGKLDPVIGRDREIERVLRVLVCRSQNQPLLVGEVGVGKTAIIRGLALLSAKPNPPEGLRGRKVVFVSVARLQYKEATEKAVSEALRARNVILVIKDFDVVTGTAHPRLDRYTNYLLKAAWASYEVACLGVTTPSVYRTLILNDPLLGRHFRPIEVRPSSTEETLAILRGLQPLYEVHHRVQIGDDALEATVELADRHLTDRCLPGKAVQLLDEACALARLKNMPPRPDMKELEDQIEQFQCEKEMALTQGDFERAARLKHQGDQLKQQREELLRQHKEKCQEVVGRVDKEAVAEVLRLITGVPL
jgi:ATP-dependent Clp protease ATP-binding subunit ClpC